MLALETNQATLLESTVNQDSVNSAALHKRIAELELQVKFQSFPAFSFAVFVMPFVTEIETNLMKQWIKQMVSNIGIFGQRLKGTTPTHCMLEHIGGRVVIGKGLLIAHSEKMTVSIISWWDLVFKITETLPDMKELKKPIRSVQSFPLYL